MTSAPGPITTATADLLSWLGRHADVPVQIGSPAEAPDSAAILAWPLELRPDQDTAGAGSPAPMRLRVRYLVYPAVGAEAAGGLLDLCLMFDVFQLVGGQAAGVPDQCGGLGCVGHEPLGRTPSGQLRSG